MLKNSRTKARSFGVRKFFILIERIVRILGSLNSKFSDEKSENQKKIEWIYGGYLNDSSLRAEICHNS